MTDNLQEAFAWLSEQKKNMLDLVIKLSKINSGSHNLAGIENVANLLVPKFKELGAIETRYPTKGYTDINDDGCKTQVSTFDFITLTKTIYQGPKLLLGGHLDTVFPKNDQEIEVKGDFLYGPGVADMKGGLVVMLYALKALEQKTNINIGWNVFLTPDEETGSLSARDYLSQLGEDNRLAFIYEPSMNLEGDMVASRMGSDKYTIVVHGKAGHVGRDFKRGKNAILKISRIIQDIHELNNENIIINIGRIRGGDAINKIPDLASAKLDIRVKNQKEIELFKSNIEQIVQANIESGFSIEYFGDFTRPIKKLDGEGGLLLSTIQEKALELGQPINFHDTGGCCDGNNIAQSGCLTVDTLGVIGEKIHSNQERMRIDSLVSRAQLSLALMASFAKGDLIK